MHINSSVPNLIGGVSQQPELLRLPSHLKAQENGYSTVTSGLSKRPSTDHRGELTAFTGGGFHAVLDFGARGIYHLEVDNGTPRVANLQGQSVPPIRRIRCPLASVPYLASATPETALKVVQEADTAFLINTEVPVQEVLNPAPATNWMALVWIKAGNYGRDYRIRMPWGGVYTYTTPDGSVSSHSVQTKTDVIASSLANQMTSAGIAGVVCKGSVITLTGGDVDGIVVDDGSGGNSIGLAYKSVRSIADLPSTNAVDGFTVKIEGGDATGAGDHYLTYDATSGAYRETRSPVRPWGAPLASSMPRMMQPYADGFQIKEAEWAGMAVGDTDTNPAPTFIGRAINDMCFFQDRMCLLTGEDFCISEVGKYFNFYRTTTVDLLDSDPIVGTVSHPKVSTLRHALPFNKRLLFFSDRAQFDLTSGDFITPRSVATSQLTQFECSSVVRPVGMGSSLYFPVDKGANTAVYNFYINGVDSLEDASDVSGHVPDYIPRDVTQLAASPVNNLLVALSKRDPASLYLYQFYQDGTQRLQSAWHRWPIATEGGVLAIAVVGTDLILAIQRDGAIFSETVPLSSMLKDYRLDRRVTVAPEDIVVDDSGFGKVSTFTLPYEPTGGTYYAAVLEGNEYARPGSVVPLMVTPGSREVSALADLTDCTVAVGLNYTFYATLGRFMVREQAGQGSAGVARGRTQVSRVWVNFTDASTFALVVAVEGRDPRVYATSGKVLGAVSATLGDTLLGEGRFGCPVLAENAKANITIVNDTPLPSSFLSVDWEGYHVTRGQHV